MWGVVAAAGDQVRSGDIIAVGVDGGAHGQTSSVLAYEQDLTKSDSVLVYQLELMDSEEQRTESDSVIVYEQELTDAAPEEPWAPLVLVDNVTLDITESVRSLAIVDSTIMVGTAAQSVRKVTGMPASSNAALEVFAYQRYKVDSFPERFHRKYWIHYCRSGAKTTMDSSTVETGTVQEPGELPRQQSSLRGFRVDSDLFLLAVVGPKILLQRMAQDTVQALPTGSRCSLTDFGENVPVQCLGSETYPLSWNAPDETIFQSATIPQRKRTEIFSSEVHRAYIIPALIGSVAASLMVALALCGCRKRCSQTKYTRLAVDDDDFDGQRQKHQRAPPKISDNSKILLVAIGETQPVPPCLTINTKVRISYCVHLQVHSVL
jgi:hypothetical protein